MQARSPLAVTRRPATESDVPFLLELRRATMAEHMRRVGVAFVDEEQLQRVRVHFEHAEIVLCEGRPVGLFKAVREGLEWHLVQIQLSPELQGRGVGERLLRELLEQADRAGASVLLSVFHGNPARRLYERLGFEPLQEGELEAEMAYRARPLGAGP